MYYQLVVSWYIGIQNGGHNILISVTAPPHFIGLYKNVWSVISVNNGRLLLGRLFYVYEVAFETARTVLKNYVITSKNNEVSPENYLNRSPDFHMTLRKWLKYYLFSANLYPSNSFIRSYHSWLFDKLSNTSVFGLQ